MYIQSLRAVGLQVVDNGLRRRILLAIVRTAKDQRPIEIDDLVVEPTSGRQTLDISIGNLFPGVFGDDAALLEEGPNAGFLIEW